MKRSITILLVMLSLSMLAIFAACDEETQKSQQQSACEKVELNVQNYKNYINIDTYFSGLNTEYIETGSWNWKYYDVYSTCIFNTQRKVNCNFEDVIIKINITSSWSLSDSTIELSLGYDGVATKSIFLYKENYTPAFSTLYPTDSNIHILAVSVSGYALVPKT